MNKDALIKEVSNEAFLVGERPRSRNLTDLDVSWHDSEYLSLKQDYAHELSVLRNDIALA